METKVLSGELYSTLIRGGAANLRANAQIVNDLNVFPIPDGDTGENMSLTITGGVSAAENAGSYSLSDMSDKLGFVLAQVACIVDPDLILLGGGMAHGAEHFMDDLTAAFKRHCLPSSASTQIGCASLFNDAGVFGAARYAMLSMPRDNAQRDWLDPDFGL